MQLPSGDPRRAQLSPALLNAVYLCGAHLSTSNTIRGYEPAFLARATTALSSALRDSHYNVMHLIQAEVLVANYFFSMSRFLEGRYHCSAAVALALSCRLTKVRSAADGPPTHGRAAATHMHIEPRQNQHLPLPRDAIEEGERIRGFWSVYALDKSWAVALGSPSHFNGVAQSGTHIDTPWPLEMAQFEAVSVRDYLLASFRRQHAHGVSLYSFTCCYVPGPLLVMRPAMDGIPAWFVVGLGRDACGFPELAYGTQLPVRRYCHACL